MRRRAHNVCELCGTPGFPKVEAHHLRPWSQHEGEPWLNTKENGLGLCSPCHRDIHAGLIVVELRETEDGKRFAYTEWRGPESARPKRMREEVALSA